MADLKISQFPAASSADSTDVLAGVQSGTTKKFSLAVILAWLETNLANIFVPTSRTVNDKALSSNITLDASDVGAVDSSDVGVADGVAGLDSNGKVPSGQLPVIPDSADEISYDNTSSGLTATDVQDAVDEIVTDLSGKQAEITASGILKGDGAGGVAAAVAGTDFQAPLTAGTDYATPAQLADKANQSQLAYVETGTTASRNYTAGQYISLNGLLYTADTAIASGATFYTSGGNKNLTECVGGGFNNLLPKEATGILVNGTYLSDSDSRYTPKCVVANGIATLSGGLNLKTSIPVNTDLAYNFPIAKNENIYVPVFRSDTREILAVRILGAGNEAYTGQMRSLSALPKGSGTTVYYIIGCSYELA